MIASCTTDETAEQITNTKGLINKTIQVNEYGEIATLLYSYTGSKLTDIKGDIDGLPVSINYSYLDNKLIKESFNAVLISGYESYIYTGDLITKSENYDSWSGKINITYKYNTLNQLIESTEIDENNVTTITKYTYNSQGNKNSAKNGTSSIYYEYDDKINPVTTTFSKEVSMVMGIYANNLTKETEGSNITTYSFIYNTEGKPITEKTYEQGKLVNTLTYYYN